jgi:hypothetical protein
MYAGRGKHEFVHCAPRGRGHRCRPWRYRNRASVREDHCEIRAKNLTEYSDVKMKCKHTY